MSTYRARVTEALEHVVRRSSRLTTMAAVIGLGLLIGVTACENPLEVENPNNLVEEDTQSPDAYPATVNGAQATVARATNAVRATLADVADEITWIGSRDGWNQLDQGALDDPGNEFADEAFTWVPTARFMVERAITKGEEFRADGVLDDPLNLARAYLYGGIIYATIGDVYDDFVFADSPTEAAPPAGEENMIMAYDTALEYLGNGLEIARAGGDQELEARILAVRARTHHARAVWQMLNPKGSVPDDPLVGSAEAAADAQDALDLVDADWRYEFEFTPATLVNNVEFINLAFQVNQRQELQIEEEYVFLDPEDDQVITGVRLEDPIDTGEPDPALSALLDEFLGANEFAPLTVVSARELHLIIAEERLAAGDDAGFETQINAVRSLDELTDYTGQIDAEEMLLHERRVNLFLQNRRLADMYRFGVEAPNWRPQSAAATTPGTFFPIGITEVRANPNL